MSKYQQLEDGIKALRCNTCRGSGECNDLEPGDIGGNTWTCPNCYGTGINSKSFVTDLQKLIAEVINI